MAFLRIQDGRVRSDGGIAVEIEAHERGHRFLGPGGQIHQHCHIFAFGESDAHLPAKGLAVQGGTFLHDLADRPVDAAERLAEHLRLEKFQQFRPALAVPLPGRGHLPSVLHRQGVGQGIGRDLGRVRVGILRLPAFDGCLEIHPREDIGMLAGRMGAALGDIHPARAEMGRLVGVADDGLLVDRLIEGAGDQITAEPHVHVIAVARDILVVEGTARVLDRRPAGNHAETMLLRGSGISLAQGRVHLILGIIIVDEIRVRGIRRVGPGLVEEELAAAGRARPDVFQEIRQPGFVTIRLARQAAGLLEDDIVPGFVRQGLRKGRVRVAHPHAVRSDFAIGVGGGVPFRILPMLLQITAADIHVADDQDVPVRERDFVQVLLDRIDAETVADAEQAQRVGPRRGGGQQDRDEEGDGEAGKDFSHRETLRFCTNLTNPVLIRYL